MISNFKFIDLFCGIGAFHQVMQSLGGTCVYACDIDADVRKTYYKNYGLMPDSDITKVNEADIPSFNVLCAGFPCQAFSKAGNRLGFSDSTKGTLFFDVLRIIKYHKPEYVLLENVRNLASHDSGNTWNTIYNSLIDAGYNLSKTPNIFSPHYMGIPQHRERVFIMCVRKDLDSIPEFKFNTDNIPKCSIESVLLDDSEIPNIERYKLSEQYIKWIDVWNDFIKTVRYNNILPLFPIWTEYLNDSTSDIHEYPDWKQNIIKKNRLLYSQNKQFIDDWLIKAKENELFYGSKAKMEWQVGNVTEPDIWDNIMQIRPSGLRIKPGSYFPALVAITQTSIIGNRKRYLTPRECARIQSFPDTFIYDDKDSQAYKQFGNSINVEVARLFAKFMFGDEKIRMKYTQKTLF